jgi:hypothetical protein
VSRCLLICFEHDRRTDRAAELPCLDLDIDVRVPWSWLDATIGSVPLDGPASAEDDPQAFEWTLARVGVLADRYQPTCLACRVLLHYVAWNIEDFDEDSKEQRS